MSFQNRKSFFLFSLLNSFNLDNFLAVFQNVEFHLPNFQQLDSFEIFLLDIPQIPPELVGLSTGTGLSHLTLSFDLDFLTCTWVYILPRNPYFSQVLHVHNRGHTDITYYQNSLFFPEILKKPLFFPPPPQPLLVEYTPMAKIVRGTYMEKERKLTIRITQCKGNLRDIFGPQKTLTSFTMKGINFRNAFSIS